MTSMKNAVLRRSGIAFLGLVVYMVLAVAAGQIEYHLQTRCDNTYTTHDAGAVGATAMFWFVAIPMQAVRLTFHCPVEAPDENA